MIEYRVLQSFNDSRLGSVKRGALIKLGDIVAKPYKTSGLIEIVEAVLGDYMHVVCIASGSSLTPEDAELVHAWRDQHPAQRKVIVTNTTYQLCPWADALYAMDAPWWKKYFKDVQKSFYGRLFSIGNSIDGVEPARIETYQNSGAGALALAARLGAKKVLLLGYDCQHTGGKKHWHGDHPKGLGNAGKVKNWPAQFELLAKKITHINVLNCSRSTALTAFPLMELEQALNECN